MNQMLFVACLVTFLALPPCLFTVRYINDKPAWWVTYIIIAALGWASALGTVFFYFQYLSDLIAQYQIPPQELVDRWANDGAKKAFALLFGWLYALIYSLPWLLLYIAAKAIRRLLLKPSNAEQGA